VSVAAIAILASHAWGLRHALPLLPPVDPFSRSPSSDVLLGRLPLPNAADRLDALHRSLPYTPGVVVAHASAESVASAYMVIAMRLWPRPVSLVACLPTPRVEQFRVPYSLPTPTWRLDLYPGRAAPISLQREASPSLAALCGATRS